MKIQNDAVGTAEVLVTEQLTAKAVGSGLLPVYATPAMVALMEEAACNALAPLYSDGETSVGVSIHVEHLAATAMGNKVIATAQVTEMSERKAKFEITVTCGESVVGTAKHTRVAVNALQFMERVEGA